MLRVALTDAGKALRRKAERVPPAVVERLGMSLAELERLRKGLDRVIDAARTVSPTSLTQAATVRRIRRPAAGRGAPAGAPRADEARVARLGALADDAVDPSCASRAAARTRSRRAASAP